MAQPTARQAQLIDQLMNPTHRSVDAAAKAAGVPRRTAYNWLADPEFRARLDDAQGQALDGVARRTVTALGHCENLYMEMMADKTQPAGIRLRAAQLLTELALRLWEARNLDRRISQLEAAHETD